MKPTKIKKVSIHIVFLAVFICIGCIPGDETTIQAILPLTGPAKEIGIDVKHGIELAVEEVNRKGGVNSKTLKVVYQDCGSDEKTALQMYNQSDKEKSIFTITCTSAVASVLSPAAEKDKHLLFALVSTAPGITRNVAYTYRYWPLAKDEAPAIESIISAQKIKRLGIIYLNDPYGQSVVAEIEKRIKTLDLVYAALPFQQSLQDLNAIQTMAEQFDAVFFTGFPSHLKSVLQKLKATHFPGAIITNSTGTATQIRSIPESDGIYAVSPAIFNPRFHYADHAKERYKAKYNKELSLYAANGYDFIKMMSGIMNNYADSKPGIKKELEAGFVFPGIMGKVELKQGKKDISFNLYPVKINNGYVDFTHMKGK